MSHVVCRVSEENPMYKSDELTSNNQKGGKKWWRRPKLMLGAMAVVAGVVGASIALGFSSGAANSGDSKGAENEDLSTLAGGLTVRETSAGFIVDTGSGLQVEINKRSCDLTSIKFDGVEMQSNFERKYSHIRSGLNVPPRMETDRSTFAKFTCTREPVTHYMIFLGSQNDIFMGTHQSSIDYSELRFLLRLRNDVIDECHKENDIRGGAVIEGKDVFGFPNGNTACKYYRTRRVVDGNTFGARSNRHNFGIYFVVSSQGLETSTGGPFFRDIEQQCTDGRHEITLYMNSDHVRTEDYRLGFHGPYSVSFRRGNEVPTDKDVPFDLMERFQLMGHVPLSGRGYVVGAVGVTDYGRNFPHTIAFRNREAQYWTKVSWNWRFSGPLMKPGTYEMILYRGELEVSKTTVTVGAGQKVSQNMRNYDDPPLAIFRIGEPDGSPLELRNGDKILSMHPSDVRMDSWSVGPYLVGQSQPRDFPMALFKDGQAPPQIHFTLPLEQAQQGRTFVIMTTHSFSGGRPIINVNDRWSSSIPPAPTKIDSRAITRGTYRGFNKRYEYPIPASALNEGLNILTIFVASGSGLPLFLSASVVIDCIEML